MLLLLLLIQSVISEETFSTSVNQFGFNLLKYIDASKSCMISPFSITTAMAVLNAGANGKPRKKLKMPSAGKAWTFLKSLRILSAVLSL